MRKTFVTCPLCKERFDSEKVEFIDISEDFQGYDLMKFKCPDCNKEVESNVRAN